MFGLGEPEVLAGAVLDCPGGAGPFAAEVRARGGRAVSADPAYALDPGEVVARCGAGLERGIAYLEENRQSYVWTFFSSLDDLRRRRTTALERFARDFAGADERYVAAALPDLPFPDGEFRLALSAYLLFAYPDHLDLDDHERSLRELLRVAREEVRVYPLIDTAYVRHPGIDELRRRLARDGVESEVRPVDYEFQRGGNEVLILWPGVTPGHRSDTASSRRSGGGGLQLLGEEVQGGAGLGLLLAAEVDPHVREVAPRLEGDRQRVPWGALGRQLEDAGTVGVEPELGDDPAAEGLRRHLQLEERDGAERDEVLEADPIRRVLLEQGPLLLVEQLLQGALPEQRPPDRVGALRHALQRAGADEAARHGIDLDAE